MRYGLRTDAYAMHNMHRIMKMIESYALPVLLNPSLKCLVLC